MSESTIQEYAQQVKQVLSDYYAGAPIKPNFELGDYGFLQNGLFAYQGNLQDLQIEFGVRPPGGQSTINFTSQSGVAVTFNAKGQAGQVNASVGVTFSEQGAILFNAAGCTAQAIEDQVQLGDAIIKLYNDGKWNKQFAVVTTLISAISTTVLMSSSSNSSITLQATDPSVAAIDLSDASLQLSISAFSSMALSITTQGALTPLIGLSGLQGWFGAGTFGPRMLRFPSPAEAHKIKLPRPFFGAIR
jgi:hypothetical protein